MCDKSERILLTDSIIRLRSRSAMTFASFFSIQCKFAAFWWRDSELSAVGEENFCDSPRTAFDWSLWKRGQPKSAQFGFLRCEVYFVLSRIVGSSFANFCCLASGNRHGIRSHQIFWFLPARWLRTEQVSQSNWKLLVIKSIPGVRWAGTVKHFSNTIDCFAIKKNFWCSSIIFNFTLRSAVKREPTKLMAFWEKSVDAKW